MFTGGKLGELFTATAFAAAIVAAIALFVAEFSRGDSRKSWERMGVTAFFVHAGSIFGIIATLFYLIYSHQYQYHYVWAHSSNELPVYYMISCFWEGQEGSFLLWCFWHSVLGIIMARPGKWRPGVLGTIASIEVILSSMILGVFIPNTVLNVILALPLVVIAGWFGYRLWANKNQVSYFELGGLLFALATLVLLFRGQGGFLDNWNFKESFTAAGLPFTLFLLALAAFIVVSFRQFSNIRNGVGSKPSVLAALTLGGIAVLTALVGSDVLKFGSNPFILLKAAFPTNLAYLENPDFVPTNGTGLNSLLQNYWMVIHPPTLFLGFAATTIPFAYVSTGLLRNDFKGWIKPSLPWMAFSAMILGVGIIMGGYWAYETLNFGGYWNWDPVENGSLVPWLIAVSGLHALLIYQRKKTHLPLAMVLVMSTFLLVLYSTFLTRSGILGETSVHTFTDLGLSGQLLLLVFLYLIGVVALLMFRWPQLPHENKESSFWSVEMMLLMGVLVLLFSGGEILLTTSLPVVNKIFGTNLAPPARIQLFYYQWNVWFAIGFGVFSGVAQFLWWKVGKKKPLSEALFRPFLIAMISGTAVMVALALNGKTFAYDKEFAAWNPLHWADELMLFASLFAFFANADVLISLLRGNKKGLKVMGGTVVHLGFSLMLVGILFSSGYDEVISKNLFPSELGGFADQDKVDNILLPKDLKRPIPGFMLEYTGKKEAKAPISNLQLLETNEAAFKIAFRDSAGDRFGMVLPKETFQKQAENAGEETVQPVSDVHSAGSGEGSIDIKYVEDFLNRNMEFLKPARLNNRILYGVNFASLQDSSKQFELFPEAEINEKEGSIIAHPNRKVFWNRDLYVYVSSVPAPEESEPKYLYHDLALHVGDTAHVGGSILQLTGVSDLSKRPEFEGKFSIVAAARVVAYTETDTFQASPVFLVDEERKPSMVSATIEALHLDFAFVGIDPESGVMRMQVQELTNPTSDYVVVKAISKPFINLLWLGTFILIFGFMIAIYRRVAEARLPSGSNPEKIAPSLESLTE